MRPLLSLAIALGLLAVAAPAAADPITLERAHTTFGVSWRAALETRRISLSDRLTLCRPSGRTCEDRQDASTAPLGGDPVVANAVGLGVELLAFGPLRLGVELGGGVGHGPSGVVAAFPVASRWYLGHGTLVAGIRANAGPWLGYVEALGGIRGVQSRQVGDLRADISAGVAGGRIGLGRDVNRLYRLSFFVDATGGKSLDVGAGFRLELRGDRL